MTSQSKKRLRAPERTPKKHVAGAGGPTPRGSLENQSSSSTPHKRVVMNNCWFDTEDMACTGMADEGFSHAPFAFKDSVIE